MRKSRKIWTDADTDFLIKSLDSLTDKEIAEELGCSRSVITNRKHKLGIGRSDKVREERRQRCQFKKGQEAWNKGLKGTHFSPGSEFKKGHKPANTKYNGCIVTRHNRRDNLSYKYIRIKENKWILLNRYNWEKRYGKIPSSHIIGFKDCDTLNCEPDNLYCLSKADNARRNCNTEKARESMKRRWKEGRFNMSDAYIAATLSYNNPELREELLKYPQLLEIKRMQIKLGREINGQESKRAAEGDGR